MKRKFMFVPVICTSVLLLSGCWDRIEVNDLSLITAAAVDRKEDKVDLSVQVLIPRAGGGKSIMSEGSSSRGAGGQTFVRSAEGLTIADAITRLQEKLPRRIFWGHCEVFVISEELAKEGIRNHADFMLRHPQVREAAYIFVSKGEAKSMISSNPPMERSSSEVLRELAKSGSGVKITLKDLMQRMSGDSRAVGLPWVEMLPPEPGKPEEQTIPFITGTAVIKKGKLVGHINDRLTRGVLWARSEIHLATVTVTPKDTDGFVTLNLLRSQSELIPSIDNGKWKMTIKGETEDDIIQNATNIDYINPTFSRTLEAQMGDDIEERTRQALEQVQKKMNADIFGFASAFHRKYPKEWSKVKNHWDEIFPDIEVAINVKARVRRPGMSTVPVGLPKDEVKKK